MYSRAHEQGFRFLVFYEISVCEASTIMNQMFIMIKSYLSMNIKGNELIIRFNKCTNIINNIQFIVLN